MSKNLSAESNPWFFPLAKSAIQCRFCSAECEVAYFLCEAGVLERAVLNGELEYYETAVG